MSDKIIGLGFLTVWGAIVLPWVTWSTIRTLRSDPPSDRREEDFVTRVTRVLGPLNWVFIGWMAAVWVVAVVMIAVNA